LFPRCCCWFVDLRFPLRWTLNLRLRYVVVTICYVARLLHTVYATFGLPCTPAHVYTLHTVGPRLRLFYTLPLLPVHTFPHPSRLVTVTRLHFTVGWLHVDLRSRLRTDGYTFTLHTRLVTHVYGYYGSTSLPRSTTFGYRLRLRLRLRSLRLRFSVTVGYTVGWLPVYTFYVTLRLVTFVYVDLRCVTLFYHIYVVDSPHALHTTRFGYVPTHVRSRWRWLLPLRLHTFTTRCYGGFTLRLHTFPRFDLRLRFVCCCLRCVDLRSRTLRYGFTFVDVAHVAVTFVIYVRSIWLVTVVRCRLLVITLYPHVVVRYVVRFDSRCCSLLVLVIVVGVVVVRWLLLTLVDWRCCCCCYIVVDCRRYPRYVVTIYVPYVDVVVVDVDLIDPLTVVVDCYVVGGCCYVDCCCWFVVRYCCCC